jgi:hypothetical protein
MDEISDVLRDARIDSQRLQRCQHHNWRGRLADVAQEFRLRGGRCLCHQCARIKVARRDDSIERRFKWSRTTASRVVADKCPQPAAPPLASCLLSAARPRA